MKKLTYLPLLFLCIFSFFLSYSNNFLNASEPTEISNCVELQAMKDNLSGDYVLINDIDCTFDTQDPDGALYNDDAGFEPVGSVGNNFAGSFDGNGYVISELYINRPSTTGVGLFSHVDGANINNVGLVDVNVTGNNSVSGFVGWTANSTISNSYSTGFVTGVGWTGGLVGYSWDSLIEGSYSWSDVNGSSNIGGLIGEAESSTISNSYSTGSVTGSGDFVGGLVGRLVGYNEEDAIEDSYATGDVNGNDYVGGLVGHNNEGSISNSFSVGSVAAEGENVGGLVGLHTPGTITNSIYDSEKSGQSDTGKGVGKTTAEMRDIFMYTEMGWDIGVNGVDLNGGYPYLSWQIPGNSPIWYIFEEVVDEEVVDEEVVEEEVVEEEVVEEEVVEEEVVEAAAVEDEDDREDEKLQNSVTNEELAKTGIAILPIFFSALSILTGALFLNRYKRFF